MIHFGLLAAGLRVTPSEEGRAALGRQYTNGRLGSLVTGKLLTHGRSNRVYTYPCISVQWDNRKRPEVLALLFLDVAPRPSGEEKHDG